jgi:GNAT superfamily N-acetyltransferase
MRLLANTVPAYGVKITRVLKGKVIGRAYLYVMTNGLHERPFGLMEDVFVEPEYRGGEIGTALVKRVITEAKRRKCYKIVATSRHARGRVHEMYVRLGFADHGREFRMDLR